MIMGVWLATSFTGNLLAGSIGSLWSGMEKADFFVLTAAVAGAAALMIWGSSRTLGRAQSSNNVT
jgi:POT family proton-dependent oligopeptide transporter